MGVDLELRPLVYNDVWSVYDTLNVNRRVAIWPLIRDLEQQDLSRARGKIGYDAYGNLLRYATAGRLADLRDLPDIAESPHNKAIWAYLSALDRDWPVVIYWC